MGCCCSTKEQKTVRWEVADETPEENKFINKEWIPKVVKKKMRHAMPLGVFGVKILDDENECDITGAGFLSNGDILIVDRNNKKLKLFSKKYKFKTSSQVPSQPENACCIPKEPIAFVTFPQGCRVRKIEVLKDDMRRVDTFNTVGKCTAISSNKYGGLAVLVNVVANDWEIHLLNAKGELQKRVHGGSLFLNPEHIAVTNSMNLVVSDRGNNTVFHITPEGYVIFGYKDLKGPTDVFVDKQGYIYVAGPERIHQLNEKGEKVQCLLSKAEIGFIPQVMAYQEKDEIILIAGKSDKVKLYSLS